jgi:predicted Zn finger-like uncharacterized protein
MLIVCPNCATSYDVTSASLGTTGRSVRCARCRTTWFAEAPQPASAAGAPLDAEPLRGSLHDDWADAASAEAEWSFGGDVPEAASDEPHPESFLAVARDAPSLVPGFDEADLAREEPPARENVESAAARRARRERAARSTRWWQPNVTVVILGLAAMIAGLIGWRAEVVRLAPQTASLYAAVGLPVNLRGLIFDGVKIGGETQDGIPVLVVSGTIVNVTQRTVEVPRLRFAVRNQAGLEVYAWTAQPAQPVLGAGETLAFRSRLASPPEDMRDAVVRFFNRRDLIETSR